MIIGSMLWAAIFGQDENHPPLTKSFPAKPSTPRKYERHRPAIQRHLDLALELNFDRKALKGRASLSFEVKSDDIDELELDCKELDVLSVRLSADDEQLASGVKKPKPESYGESLDFRLSDDVLTVTGIGEHKHVWKSSKRFRLSVEYRVLSPKAGIYFVDPKDSPWVSMPCIWTQGQDSDSPFWFPCQDDPRLKVTTRLTIQAPQGWHVQANGEKKSDGAWHMLTPHSVYLVALVAGPFAVFEEDWKGKKVSVLLPRPFADLGKSILRTTIKMLDFYGEYWGFPFPWPQYTQAFVPEFIYGGMENTTLTINTDTVLGESVFAESFADWRDGLVMHEMAHQWFGDWVTCESWSEGWLNEGFATQSERLWEEHAFGAVTGLFCGLKYHVKGYLEEASTYTRPLVCNHYEFPSEIFDRHLYQKGAMVLTHLRDLMGEQAFQKAVCHYLTSHPSKPVTTSALMHAIEESSGWNPRRFFDNYVYGSGHVELKIDLSLAEKDKLLTCTLGIEGKSLLSSGDTAIETYVAFFGEKGLLEERKIALDVSLGSFNLSAPKGTLFAIVDPRATIVGSVKPTFSEAIARTILKRYEAHKNGYFAFIAAASLLEKQGAHVRGVWPAILDWLREEKSFRARAAGYELLGQYGQALKLEHIRPLMEREKSVVAKEALLETFGKFECEDPQGLVEELLGLASDEKELVAYRTAALRAITDLYSRLSALRLSSHSRMVLGVAFELMNESRHFGSVASGAAGLAAELATGDDLKRALANVDNTELPGPVRRSALFVCSRLSERYPELRRDLRPALRRYVGARGPQSLTAALPQLWLQSGDVDYASCFERFIGQKSYGLASFYIPRARRLYASFLGRRSEGDLRAKLTEIEDLSRRVKKLEAALGAIGAKDGAGSKEDSKGRKSPKKAKSLAKATVANGSSKGEKAAKSAKKPASKSSDTGSKASKKRKKR